MSTAEERALATCQRKLSWYSEHLALNAAFLINLAHVDQGAEPVVPYDCPYCQDWHHTSHPGRP